MSIHDLFEAIKIIAKAIPITLGGRGVGPSSDDGGGPPPHGTGGSHL